MNATITAAAKYREPKWHAGSSRWFLRIGKKHNQSGQPVEASFYWNGDSDRCPADVVADAVEKQREFARIKAQWPELGARWRKAKDDADLRDWSEPVWFD